MVELTREEYNIIAKNRGIIEPQKMSAQKLLSTINRYESRHKSRHLSKIGLEKMAKRPNILENELNQAENLQIKSIDELKQIARLRRIKNREKLAKEDVIISLLKSESSTAEQNFRRIC